MGKVRDKRPVFQPEYEPENNPATALQRKLEEMRDWSKKIELQNSSYC